MIERKRIHPPAAQTKVTYVLSVLIWNALDDAHNHFVGQSIEGTQRWYSDRHGGWRVACANDTAADGSYKRLRLEMHHARGISLKFKSKVVFRYGGIAHELPRVGTLILSGS